MSLLTNREHYDHSPEFSVIITSYYEEGSIAEFYARLSSVLKQIGRTYEIIFVNDGSTDKTFELHSAMFDEDDNVTAAIDLFTNVGQTCAMSAGIAQAKGRHFIFMDSDLQLDPEELPLLMQEFDKGYDIVSGYRKDRADSWLRKLPSWFANVVMRKVSGHQLSDFGCTFKIYDGTLIRAFGFGEYKPWKTAFVFAQAQWVKEVAVSHHQRKYGKSGWTFKKLLGFLFEHIVGLSDRPFQLLAIFCLLMTGVFMLRITTAWLFPFSILPEISNGMILNITILGLLMMLAVMSAVGEYAIRSYHNSEKDPIYIVKVLKSKIPEDQ